MKTKIGFAVLIIFITGCILGVSFGLRQIEASSPEGEVSAGEANASVIWHEHWQATRGYVSSETGYQQVILYDGANWRQPADAAGSAINSGEMVTENITGDTKVTVNPDMVINRWRVHGHIHMP